MELLCGGGRSPKCISFGLFKYFLKIKTAGSLNKCHCMPRVTELQILYCVALSEDKFVFVFIFVKYLSVFVNVFALESTCMPRVHKTSQTIGKIQSSTTGCVALFMPLSFVWYFHLCFQIKARKSKSLKHTRKYAFALNAETT